MTACDEIIAFLNSYLNAAQLPDASQNGLQVQGPQEVRKVAFGVSAGLELFRTAKQAGAQLVITHHGLLWGKEERLTGTFGARVAYLCKNDLALAAYHLPLDMHPVIGHNACLIKKLGAQDPQPFGRYHGQNIGFKGQIDLPLAETCAVLEQFCGAQGRLLAFGPEHIRTVGIVSGGGWNMLPQAVEEKLDLYVTGVVDEPVQEWCREGKINCLALGHYNSEKPGVLAMMDLVKREFGVETEFIDIANPI